MKTGNSFGARLYKQRRASDLARKALADQVGCAEIAVRRIETAVRAASRGSAR